MVHRVFEQIFWYAPLALQAVLMIAMLVRGLYRKLPYFFCYTTNIVLQAIVFLIFGKDWTLYEYFYWLGEVVSWVLGMAVIYEIYANLLKEYAVLQRLGTILFWITGLVLVLVALWTAYNAPGADVARLMKGALTLERSVRIVQCGLLVVVFVFASFFGLSWKNYLFGIALGFAIFVCAELAVVAVRAYTEVQLSHSVYRFLKPASYDLALVIWTVYVVKAWRVVDLRLLPRTELAAWNDALQELLHR